MGLSTFLNTPVQTRGLRRGSKLAAANSSLVHSSGNMKLAQKGPNLGDRAWVTQPPSQSAPLPPLQNGALSEAGITEITIF